MKLSCLYNYTVLEAWGNIYLDDEARNFAKNAAKKLIKILPHIDFKMKINYSRFPFYKQVLKTPCGTHLVKCVIKIVQPEETESPETNATIFFIKDNPEVKIEILISKKRWDAHKYGVINLYDEFITSFEHELVHLYDKKCKTIDNKRRLRKWKVQQLHPDPDEVFPAPIGYQLQYIKLPWEIEAHIREESKLRAQQLLYYYSRYPNGTKAALDAVDWLTPESSRENIFVKIAQNREKHTNPVWEKYKDYVRHWIKELGQTQK